jgi:hypothetical protein
MFMTVPSWPGRSLLQNLSVSKPKPASRNPLEEAAKELLRQVETTEVGAFFGARLVEELHRLVVRVTHAGHGEMEFLSAHHLSELIFAELGDAERGAVFRGLHRLADNSEFDRTHTRDWQSRMTLAIQDGVVGEVRRLAVVDHSSQMESASTAGLTELHRRFENHTLRFVTAKQWRTACADFQTEVPRDFGVYGQSYVFWSTAAAMNSLAGVWSRLPSTIARFSDLFDACWVDATQQSDYE